MAEKIQKALKEAQLSDRDIKVIILGSILDSIDTTHLIDRLHENGLCIEEQDLMYLIDEII